MNTNQLTNIELSAQSFSSAYAVDVNVDNEKKDKIINNSLSENSLGQISQFQQDEDRSSVVGETVKDLSLLFENEEIDDVQKKEEDVMDESSNDEQIPDEESSCSLIKSIKDYLSDKFSFRYNIIANRTEYRKKNESEFSSVNDRFLNTTWFLCHEDGIKCSSTMLRDLINSDYSIEYDPFIKFFDKLKPHNGIDYIKSFCDCFHLVNEDDRNYLEKYSRINFRAIVGCAYYSEPNHICLTLVGKQGIYKTTALNYLCPKSLRGKYSYTGPINGDKDSHIRLGNCFLINADEGTAMNRSNIEIIKSMLTMKEINLRLPYGHYPKTFPRRASFVASLNNQNFLIDTTGSRRFLIFEIENIDIEALKQIDMDDVYSQAFSEYKAGMQRYLTQEDNILIQANNRKFDQYSHVEEVLLTRYRIPKDNESCQYLSATQIGGEIKHYLGRKPSQSDIQQIGKLMSKHGFEQKSKRINSIFNRYWVVYKCHFSTNFEE